jgi:hypothetical protein
MQACAVLLCFIRQFTLFLNFHLMIIWRRSKTEQPHFIIPVRGSRHCAYYIFFFIRERTYKFRWTYSDKRYHLLPSEHCSGKGGWAWTSSGSTPLRNGVRRSVLDIRQIIIILHLVDRDTVAREPLMRPLTWPVSKKRDQST